MPYHVLVLEKEIPLKIAGIDVGKVKVQVFEGDSVHLQQGDMNEKYLIAKGVFNDKTYEVKGIRGGVSSVLEELLKKIQKDLE